VDPKLLDRAKWVQRAVYDCTHGTLVPGKYPGDVTSRLSINIQKLLCTTVQKIVHCCRKLMASAASEADASIGMVLSFVC